MGQGLSTIMHGASGSARPDPEIGMTDMGRLADGRLLPQSGPEAADTQAFQDHLSNTDGVNSQNQHLNYLNQSTAFASQHPVKTNNAPLNLGPHYGSLHVGTNESEIDTTNNHGTIAVGENNGQVRVNDNHNQVSVAKNQGDLSSIGNTAGVHMAANVGTFTSSSLQNGGMEHVGTNTGKINIENSNGNHTIEHNVTGHIHVGPLGPNAKVFIGRQDGKVTQELASGKVVEHRATGGPLTLNDKGHVSYWNARANIKNNPGVAAGEYGGTLLGSAVTVANVPASVFNIGHLFHPSKW